MSSISLTTTTTTNSTTSSTRKYMDHMEPLKDMSWSLLLSSMKRKPVEPNFQEDEAFAWSEACSSNSHSLPSKYFSFMTTTTTHLSIHDLNPRDHESSSKALNLSNEDDDLYWFPEISWKTLEQVRCGCSSCRYPQATTCGNSCSYSGHYVCQEDHHLGSDWKPLTRISSLSTSTNIQQELDLRRSDQVREEEGCTSFLNPILPHVPASYAVNET
ncbi:hypothetical protein C9374_006281 [Naegleria lovaniensis]|uniref:Uncharacterized protein n=1 Tax=Naegleria lovaniensis TaxID=51637 RepID=A0AA88GN02_NAELO|nr:uncharacterized protein C9374_006281 [Naegleria lovaniensis]KAG2381292.1 hypothetical protein C9374_006281 [Naegleria lovaniensis]